MNVDLKIAEKSGNEIKYSSITDYSFKEVFRSHIDYFIYYFIAAFLICPLDVGWFCSLTAIVLCIVWLYQAAYRKRLRSKLHLAQVDYALCIFKEIGRYLDYEVSNSNCVNQEMNLKIKLFPLYTSNWQVCDMKIYCCEDEKIWSRIIPNTRLYNTLKESIENFKFTKDKYIDKLSFSYSYAVELEIWMIFLGLIGFLDLSV